MSPASSGNRQPRTATPPAKLLPTRRIPESPDAASSGSTGSNEHTAAAPATNDSHSGEQWKAKIQAQKNSIASLQNQIDRLNSSIHFVEANRYTNGAQYNQRQAQKQDEVQRMQKQLDEQKQKLQDMQESARKAGLGSSVYDP